MSGYLLVKLNNCNYVLSLYTTYSFRNVSYYVIHKLLNFSFVDILEDPRYKIYLTNFLCF